MQKDNNFIVNRSVVNKNKLDFSPYNYIPGKTKIQGAANRQSMTDSRTLFFECSVIVGLSPFRDLSLFGRVRAIEVHLRPFMMLAELYFCF
jgi:hypothetical protein